MFILKHRNTRSV